MATQILPYCKIDMELKLKCELKWPYSSRPFLCTHTQRINFTSVISWHNVNNHCYTPIFHVCISVSHMSYTQNHILPNFLSCSSRLNAGNLAEDEIAFARSQGAFSLSNPLVEAKDAEGKQQLLLASYSHWSNMPQLFSRIVGHVDPQDVVLWHCVYQAS